MYTNYSDFNNYNSTSNGITTYTSEDDRFFLAPFLVGGLAGTALGYGIANNNQINSQPIPMYPMPMYPVYPSCNCGMNPTYSTSNNYYY